MPRRRRAGRRRPDRAGLARSGALAGAGSEGQVGLTPGSGLGRDAVHPHASRGPLPCDLRPPVQPLGRFTASPAGLAQLCVMIPRHIRKTRGPHSQMSHGRMAP
jgi:hypothetical protein